MCLYIDNGSGDNKKKKTKNKKNTKKEKEKEAKERKARKKKDLSNKLIKLWIYIMNGDGSNNMKIGTTGKKSAALIRYKNQNESYEALFLKIPSHILKQHTGENIEQWIK